MSGARNDGGVVGSFMPRGAETVEWGNSKLYSIEDIVRESTVLKDPLSETESAIKEFGKTHRLLGVVQTDGAKIAAVKNLSSNDTMFLRESDAVDGFVVSEIRDCAMTFEKIGIDFQIELSQGCISRQLDENGTLTSP